MLHEILLSLSGHPSALFDAQPGSPHVTSTASRLLSPPEVELLSCIGHLSRLHRTTRDHAAKIATSHPSTVCRAVATSIISHHLSRFQCKILDIENHILKQDASTVGAYNIVPLAGIVSEFSTWTRVMEWLWEISIFILPPDTRSKGEQIDQKAAAGASLIDKLRTEAQTGYPDIEEAARHLGTVAETSWLRQLSVWLLYGRLPSFGASDFFVQPGDAGLDDQPFVLQNKLLPKFVTRQTASSILFIGKSLTQIRSLPSAAKIIDAQATVSELDLLPKHVAQLSQITVPIPVAKLSEAVANIRLSLSQNLLQHLLPREKIVETLAVLHQFFFIGRGEFALTLIAEADDKAPSRGRGTLSTKPSHSMKGFLLKEAEINQILARSFSVLSTLASDDDHTDDILDVATELVHIAVNDPTAHRPRTPGRAKDADSTLPQLPSVLFDEILLSVSTSLTMEIPSPLDLFVTRADVDVYSGINGYLLAIRRAHLHLAQLWRNSSLRREHPCPPGYQHSNSARGKMALNKRRQRTAQRTREMRKVWATCAAAIFFLAESEAYFHGGVIQQLFNHFISWVTMAQDQAPEGSLRSTTEGNAQRKQQEHDPEALALAHRRFLSSVAYSLLLTDVSFTKAMRTLCMHVEELVAYVTRLASIQQNLDLEDEGVEDYAHNFKSEEKEVNLELDRARRRLDSDLKALVDRLREIDSDRISTSMPDLDVTIEDSTYRPLKVGGINQLLIKLV
ncbi:hypothetical protein N0V83_006495 [Neocucurbitaria cava]|uniref:Spindle pole body component n=1 Tax=Neocucurbitaria cava TaxID=798079 RepID=A0A9W8Y5F0_9PLEO|nr:hypothetical protein N0V83_006495 [Neocucurbitaria cava]